MSAAEALLARVRKAGVEVRVDGGDLVLRGKPDADLVWAIREAKGELVELLTREGCRTCGAEPTVDGRPGGFGLEGWRCTRCQLAAGMPVGTVTYLDETPHGTHWPSGVDGDANPQDGGDSPRWVLLSELKKLARRNQDTRRLQSAQGVPVAPEGIDEAELRSAFICAWHHQRTALGQPKLTPLQFTEAFKAALKAQMACRRIVYLIDGRLQLVEERQSKLETAA